MLIPPAIKPGECHPRAATSAVVLNQQPHIDALHPNVASVSVAALVAEGDSSLGRNTRFKVSVLKIAAWGLQGHYAFNLQLRVIALLDLDEAARCAPLPIQSDAFGDDIGATGVSAARGSQPLIQTCCFANGDW